MRTFVLDRSCSIETGDRPSAIEMTAREELESAFRAIFGEFCGPPRRVIIGTPESSPLVRGARHRLGLDSVAEDAFVIDVCHQDGDEVLLLGARHGRGVLYGCYAILEMLGADFLLDPPAFPVLDQWTLRLPVEDGPVFPTRCASGVLCGTKDIPWYARNRFNVLLTRLDGKDFEEVAQLAARYGIDLGVCGGDFTPVEDQGVPLNRKTGHALCAALDETWDYFERLLARRIEGLDSCRACSFRLTDYRPNPIFTNCKSCSHIHPADRILRALKIAQRIASERDAVVMFRTWGLDFMPEAYRHGSHQVAYGWEPQTHLRKIVNESPEDSVLVTKETWGDFMITYPPNHWIGLCGPHAQLIEYQVEPSEYRGNDTIPCSMVERWSGIMQLARERGVEGTWACSWGTNLAIDDGAPIGELLNSLNTHAFVRLSWNPDADIEGIYQEWAERIFPECSSEMIEILRLSIQAVNQMMYVHGQRFNNHSGISGRLHHVEWCFHHYGFNNWGGTVTRAMLDATDENLEDVLREKEDAIRIAREMRAILDSAESRMPAGTFRNLRRMLEGMLGLALLWREYARAFFLFAMLRETWSEEKAKRLETACEMMSRIAEGLPDNSDLTRVMWRGAQSPSLTSNIVESVESLIADYREFLARKGDTAQ